MQSETLAPWAEVVPNHDDMTVDDLLGLPDDGWMYELVEGRLVRMSPSGGGASSLAVRLAARVLAFVEDRNLGKVTGGDGEYVLSKPGEKVTSLAPDVAFVCADRVPPRTSPDYARPWQLAPDLAVEIASPNQLRPEMAAKARLYLAVGVRLVWVLWPGQRRIDVWLPGGTRPSRILGPADMLDGLDVLPGFTYPVDRVFD